MNFTIEQIEKALNSVPNIKLRNEGDTLYFDELPYGEYKTLVAAGKIPLLTHDSGEQALIDIECLDQNPKAILEGRFGHAPDWDPYVISIHFKQAIPIELVIQCKKSFCIDGEDLDKYSYYLKLD